MSVAVAFAPATVANVGVGFDVLGFALREPGDRVTVRVSDDDGVVVIPLKVAADIAFPYKILHIQVLTEC